MGCRTDLRVSDVVCHTRDMTTAIATQRSNAYQALKTAKAQTQPLDAELTARLLAHCGQERMDRMNAEVAAIAATIPALQAEYDRLDALVCSRCSGSGVYSGPSNATRRGVAYCFYCNGVGTAEAQRRMSGAKRGKRTQA